MRDAVSGIFRWFYPSRDGRSIRNRTRKKLTEMQRAVYMAGGNADELRACQTSLDHVIRGLDIGAKPKGFTWNTAFGELRFVADETIPHNTFYLIDTLAQERNEVKT